jgi:transmembrane sensor
MNHEHIYQLLLQKRNGTISEQDNTYVTGLINIHEDIELMWKAISHTSHIPGEEKFWHEMNAHIAWQQVEERVLPGRKASWWSNRWLIAAVTISVIATSTVLIFKTGTFTSAAPKPLAVFDNKKIEGLNLTLANGETVALPYNENKREIDASGVQLSAGPNKLQYTAGEGDKGFNTLTVPPKMDYKLVLSDGTEVWLNATTKLRFPFNFSGDKREVYLEGEAFFDVAKNADHPFIVHTGKSEIQVLGTSFNVSAYKNGVTSTSLLSGAVVTRTGNTEAKLKPGQASVVTGDKQAIREFDEDEVTGWMKGEYIFHNVSLRDIASVLERWYGVTVVFDNNKVAEKRFTGGMEKLHNVDEFMETMKIIGDVKYAYDKDGVLHIR